MIILALLLPLTEPTTVIVDICELNHVLNGDGHETLTQWIWLDYDWHIEHGYDYWIRDWRMQSDVPPPIGNVQEWQDKKTNRRMRVAHRMYRETWSYGDVEVKERDRLPTDQRRGLR